MVPYVSKMCAVNIYFTLIFFHVEYFGIMRIALLNLFSYCLFDKKYVGWYLFVFYVYIYWLLLFSGFSELSQDDQLILIKTGFFEIWLTRMARMFNRNDNNLLFEDGSLIAKEELDIVYNVSMICFCERGEWWIWQM